MIEAFGKQQITRNSIQNFQKNTFFQDNFFSDIQKIAINCLIKF